MNKYGGSEWNDKYSKDFGDGEITWGRKWFLAPFFGLQYYRGYFKLTPILLAADAKLTPLGEKQAEEVHALWKTELDRLDDPIPIVCIQP